MPSILVGDPIRVKVTFRDQLGVIVDPQTVPVYLYDDEDVVLTSAMAEKSDIGKYYYDWEPSEAGVFYIEFQGLFEDSTVTIVREQFIVEDALVDPSPELKLGEDYIITFVSGAEPLYADPDEMKVFFPEAEDTEILEYIFRYSEQVKKLTKDSKELPFVAYEYVRAATLCALSRVYEIAAGDESSISLGDLSVTKRSYPRSTINRANASDWCELAVVLYQELVRVHTGMRAVVRGARYPNPMPDRTINKHRVRR